LEEKRPWLRPKRIEIEEMAKECANRGVDDEMLFS
jgi:hypothetical protein